MNMLKKTLIAASLAAVGFAGHAHARQSMTDTFDVSITVEGTCNVLTASDIDFGTGSIGEIDQTGTINVRCSLGHPYSIKLGGGSSGNGKARTMLLVNGSRDNTVAYELSHISHGGVIWNDDERTGLVTGSGAGLSTDVSHTVYGRAWLTGDEALGQYRDTVTATLEF